ncbi:MAG TPA: peptidoglycan-binding domain-containing protein [Bryobacteraceae bacterium]|nr:peptidoglycan-binding domain-containing protein [Bryobacteraceae bacterium]
MHSTTAAKRPVSYRVPPKATPGTRTTSARSVRRPSAPASTWRARQMAPAPERYKEIQEALVAKGYLSAEEANGAWNSASTEALKRFQGEQNLESSGKINSLSLIALGLGPKHDSASLRLPPPQPAQDAFASGR